MGEPIRVLMINKCRLFTEAVGSLMKHQHWIKLIDCPESLDGASTAGLSELPDVMLVEAEAKGRLTTQLVRKIKDESPQVKIIILGLGTQEDEVLRFIEAGAIGYMSKEHTFADLLNLVEAVHHEQTQCPSAIAASVLARISELSGRRLQRQPARRVNLTGREKEILLLISANLSNKEIAGRLGITLNTVKNHVHNILEKFGVNYRRELVQCADECGLLTRPAPPWSSSAED